MIALSPPNSSVESIKQISEAQRLHVVQLMLQNCPDVTGEFRYMLSEIQTMSIELYRSIVYMRALYINSFTGEYVHYDLNRIC